MSAQHPRRQPRPNAVPPPPIPTPADSASSSSTDKPRPAVPSIETSINPQLPQQQTPRHTPNEATPSSAAPVFRVPESPRSVSSPKPAKIAIPRLKRSLDDSSDNAIRSGGRHRVNHACEPCRHRKTKCSGERPICRHCQDFKITCYYADGKRDRAKKQFGSMSEKLADYEKLLRDLSTRVGEADARRIKASLDKETVWDGARPETGTPTTAEPELDDEDSGQESDASAGAGSTGALDRTEEDFTKDSARTTGFMGKNSDVKWMQRLKQVIKDEGIAGDGSSTQDRRSNQDLRSFRQKQTDPQDKEPDPVSASNYHLDDLAISTFEAIDPYEMPTMETANQLFCSFFERIHPTFPVMGYANLSNQFQKFISGQIQSPPVKWLAIVNLIFAISARYSHLIQADWKGDERDHLIYFDRARMLALNESTWLAHPDLQQIQVYALSSFYLMATGQINRSWVLCGLAIRCATALGMNVRNDSPELKNSLKEIRYRMWWAIYVLEHQLCSMTGRVNCILDEHCTAPLPIPLQEDKFDTEEGRKMLSKEHQQSERRPRSRTHTPSAAASTPSTDKSRSVSKPESSRSPAAQQTYSDLEWARDVPPSSALYFLHTVQGARLTQLIFQKLYNPSAMDGTWSQVQTMIEQCNTGIETWYRTLPNVFDFKRNQRDREYYDFRLTLRFLYFGTKITINRPCLCRLDQKIPGQSEKSNEFNRSSAAMCVGAAVEMVRMIPDEPNTIGLRRAGPWWNLLHYLVQAATVLILEISFRAHHMPEEADSIFEAAKKILRWLHALGEDDLSAKRAWYLINQSLRDAGTRIGREVTGVPSHPPSAAGSVHAGQNEMTGLDAMTISMAPFQTNTFSATPHDKVSGIHNMAFSHYDQSMQYGYYMPMQQGMEDQMRFQQGEHEMDFILTEFDPGQGEQGVQSGHRRLYN